MAGNFVPPYYLSYGLWAGGALASLGQLIGNSVEMHFVHDLRNDDCEEGSSACATCLFARADRWEPLLARVFYS